MHWDRKLLLFARVCVVMAFNAKQKRNSSTDSPIFGDAFRNVYIEPKIESGYVIIYRFKKRNVRVYVYGIPSSDV